jgi:hypothetical protein
MEAASQLMFTRLHGVTNQKATISYHPENLKSYSEIMIRKIMKIMILVVVITK